MKVAELKGALLDYWAGKTDGKKVFIHACVNGAACSVHDRTQWSESSNYSPSTDWSQGGPITEREGIEMFYITKGDVKLPYACFKGLQYSGPDPLIAAMRCYVASKFGEEVPDE
ncbi:Protein of unknown function [Nitrosospira sp. Nl5]|uniref:phage protein NinX family protein n=1 Tax=Nitrosospira sp. Nl5 TaxID=200120 RepID=UPI000887E1CF|nr:phage protein NinX family protein [Nitrosospira sp. Nl5]SCX92368.1 Protein of unknown function [Nitrosospira sp. Nl5]